MGLILVQADGVWVPVFETGRFSLERDACQSVAHVGAAVDKAKERMIADLAKRGYEFVGPDWQVKGPLGHVEFSADASAEPDPRELPHPLDEEGNRAWEAAERARTARKYGEQVELADFSIGAWFKRREPRHYRDTKGTVWQ